MNLLDEVEIYSISWEHGDRTISFREGQIQTMGSPKKDYKIAKIVRDENHFHVFGNMVYKIYISTPDGPKLWRYIENKPVDVICKL